MILVCVPHYCKVQHLLFLLNCRSGTQAYAKVNGPVGLKSKQVMFMLVSTGIHQAGDH